MEKVRLVADKVKTITNKVFAHIFVTTNYAMFSLMKGNRKINPAHKARLKKSMQQRYLISPILVNELMEIIDGQHRFFAAKELGLPIYYYIIDGYRWAEIQRLNTNMKNWGKTEYLEAYCDMGYAPYITLKNVWQKYPEFNLTSLIVLLSGVAGNRNTSNKDAKTKENPKGNVHVKPFEEGEFIIPNLNKSIEYLEKIRMLKKHIDFYNETLFVRAMLSLFKNENYNHSVFLQKLAYQSAAMQKCTSISAYVLLIEDIYNYRNRNKVSLRY